MQDQFWLSGSIMIISRSFPLNTLRSSIWILGIPSCLFGSIDRVIAIFADNYVSYLELSHFFTTAFLLVSWIALKPENEEEFNTTRRLEDGKLNSNLYQNQAHFLVTRSRMLELEKYHILSQLHVLPFPYLSQIYHLLNLKHLESIHSLSLGNLKVLDVSDFQSTPLGGSIKFRTTLNSPFNALKIWRQPVVEVELILHTPYTVELKIPVYGGKKMIVMFNAFPLSKTSHEFLIDIYTDLPYPRFLLRVILHLASLFTLYEDLPYLKKLSERSLERLLNPAKASSQKTMWLFKRFVNLYASRYCLEEA
ncbi:hypothetical protein K9N68_00550 [Kovacikia minuta CCNUW1]|uniref:hypothetical protein n=1 Tax=Kovacikia minuta TaxID=2931930 RepID=UPI001CCA5CB9|nr:hypothetical protein [Kovacikia minuta]UBF26538.1 hypothetical protein K9N68_00550 [Kovacikia minuta CCNUW1]